MIPIQKIPDPDPENPENLEKPVAAPCIPDRHAIGSASASKKTTKEGHVLHWDLGGLGPNG